MLDQFAQHALGHVAVHFHVHHVAPVGAQRDVRPLGLLGKSRDAVDRLLDVLIDLHPIRIGQQFRPHRARALRSRRGDFLHALDTADRFLDHQDHALLDFVGASAGQRHAHGHQVELEVGKHLLLDLRGHEEARRS